MHGEQLRVPFGRDGTGVVQAVAFIHDVDEETFATCAKLDQECSLTVTGEVKAELDEYRIFPAKQYVTARQKIERGLDDAGQRPGRHAGGLLEALGQRRAADHRTDIFSFGIILHEMLCGKRPFQAASTAALMSSILRDPPDPISQVKPGVPERLGSILQKCLEKDPLLRYPSADQLWLELKEVEGSFGGAASAEIEAAVERVLAKVPSAQVQAVTPETGVEVGVETDREVSIPLRRDRPYAWLVALALAASLLAGLYPASRLARSSPSRALQEE